MWVFFSSNVPSVGSIRFRHRPNMAAARKIIITQKIFCHPWRKKNSTINCKLTFRIAYIPHKPLNSVHSTPTATYILPLPPSVSPTKFKYQNYSSWILALLSCTWPFWYSLFSVSDFFFLLLSFSSFSKKILLFFQFTFSFF